MRRNQIKKGDFRCAGHFSYFVSEVRYRKTLAGFPATMAFAGTSLVTTLPAPTMAFSPMATLLRMVEPEPIDEPLRTMVFSTFQSASVCSSPEAAVARGYESLMKVTLWPIKTLSSISTPSQMKVWLEILTLRPMCAFFWISTNVPMRELSPTEHPYKFTNP